MGNRDVRPGSSSREVGGRAKRLGRGKIRFSESPTSRLPLLSTSRSSARSALVKWKFGNGRRRFDFFWSLRIAQVTEEARYRKSSFPFSNIFSRFTRSLLRSVSLFLNDNEKRSHMICFEKATLNKNERSQMTVPVVLL